MGRQAAAWHWILSVLLLHSVAGCGTEGTRSPASPALALIGRAEVTISELSVQTQALEAGYRYEVRLSLENAGTGTAMLTGATFVLWFPEGRGTASPPVSQLFPSLSLTPGGTVRGSVLDLTERIRGYATRLTVIVAFTDATGAHSTSRDLEIAPSP